MRASLVKPLLALSGAAFAALTIRALTVEPTLSAMPAARPAALPADGRPDPERGAIAAEVETILERPIFRYDRRRPAVAPVAAPAEAALALPSWSPPPRLAGIMMTPVAGEALFARAGGRFVSARQGDLVDGWTVSRIEQQRVVLTGMEGEVVLEPNTARTGAKPVVDRRPNAAWAAANPVLASAIALAASHGGRGDPYAPGALPVSPFAIQPPNKPGQDEPHHD